MKENKDKPSTSAAIPQAHGGALLPGAPKGNDNYRKGRMYRRAILRALAENPGALDRIAKKAIADAEGGNDRARDHVIDRLDGKAPQEITGAGGGPLQVLALTPKILAELSEDELTAIERALPALERLGAARHDPGGEGPEGETA